MNNHVLTITLLIVAVCNIGTLWLYYRVWKWTRTPAQLFDLWEKLDGQNGLILNRLAEAADRQRGMKDALLDDGQRTRQDIAHVNEQLSAIRGEGHWTLNDVAAMANAEGMMTRQTIENEHKQTRKETQEIKTRLTWSRKRDLKGGR